MRRVENNANWSLFNPLDVPGLARQYGPTFDAEYKAYEASGVYRVNITARTIWNAILECQMETGGPFILYKDSINGQLSLTTFYRRS